MECRLPCQTIHAYVLLVQCAHAWEGRDRVWSANSPAITIVWYRALGIIILCVRWKLRDEYSTMGIIILCLRWTIRERVFHEGRRSSSSTTTTLEKG